MKLTVAAFGSTKAGDMEVSEGVFGKTFSPALIHQVVTAQLAGRRQGTKQQKNRSDVSGGGRKPWRQKGTGNARAGTIRSPLWRSGGVTFAAKPRDYSQKVNRKMFQGAMRSILSELVRQERLMVVKDIALKEPKTKELVALLAKSKVEDKKILLIKEADDKNVELASRNIIGVRFINVDAVDPVNLVDADKVIITTAAAEKLNEKLA